MNYDFDTIVIGGGPAGSSAAIRTRWIRTYNSIPASVAIFDENGIGGIANWKELRITGESWKVKGSQLMEKMKKDIENLHIPVYKEEVINIRKKNDFFIINTNKREYCSLSIVIATGLSLIKNHKEFLGKGLIPTLKDHEYMKNYLSKTLKKDKGKNFLIIGTKPVKKFYNLFQKVNRDSVKTILLIENKKTRIVSFVKSKKELNGVKIKTRSDSKQYEFQTIKTDKVILDFESYMLENNSTYFLSNKFKKKGFVTVNNSLSTSESGLFAAGDVIGPPFCVAKAIGDGIKAGFEAYKYTFIKKFGIEPPMYAFYPSKSEIYDKKTGYCIDIITDNHKPKLLDPNIDIQISKKLLDGKHTIKQILKKNSIDSKTLQKILISLTNEKRITFHI